MLEQLRSQTKVILWVVVVGFVGFMFFDWGMNRVRPGSERLGLAGKVGHDRITNDEFHEEYRNQRAAYYQQNDINPTPQTEQEVADRTWETLVQRHLLYDEAAKDRLLPTDDEVLLEIQNNPPPFIRAQPIFQTDSVFDQSKYLAALSDPNLDLRFLENYVRANLPYQKLMDYVGSSVRVTEDEADMFLRVLQEQVRITYLEINPLSDVRGSVPEPTEQEVADYYGSNTEDFRIPEKRLFTYVESPKEASAEDRTDARTKIEDAYALVDAGEPFDDIAKHYSDDAASAANGGDLGWLKPGRLPARLDSAARALQAGEVSGIIETDDGYHIIRVDDKRTTGGIEEWKISDIVSTLQASPLTIENKREDMLGLVEQARSHGLEAAADERGFEVKTSQDLAKPQISPFFGISQTDADRVFEARKGTILDPVEGSDNIYAIMVAEVIPSRIPALEDIRDFVKQAYVHSVRRGMARQMADQALAAMKAGKTLEQAASEVGLTVHETQPFTRMAFVPGIGRENDVIATAFALDAGQTSGIVEYSDQFYIIRIDEKIPVDQDQLAKSMANLRMSLIRTKQQAYLSDWYERLKKHVRIEDYRTLATY